MVMVTERVLEKPTVIVPKSIFDGLIWIWPSLPAPMIVRVLEATLCWLAAARAVMDAFMVELSLLMVGFGIRRPEPGAKKPTCCLTGSNKFLAKIGTLI